MKTVEQARFEARMPQEQKELFEEAASLGGFKTLTDFVLTSARIHAEEIIERHHAILVSKKDKEIFFAALMHPPKPNAHLKKAAAIYKTALKKK
jgi:uncharacterized protein (DUF1778 family)